MAQSPGMQEWRASWPLPFVAMLGMSGAATFTYASGVLMAPMTAEFGWSRAEYSTALTAVLLLGLIFMPILGRVIDKFGPRPVALCGIGMFVVGMSLLSLVGGEIWQWWALAMLAGICGLGVAPPVWVTAVVDRFHAARGMALAIALAGIGLASAIWPLLAAFYVSQIGWRMTFPALAITWAIVLLPLTLIFFFDSRSKPSGAVVPKEEAPAQSYRAVFLSRTFICLAASGGIFACVALGMTLHVVPILGDRGLDMTTAAAAAGLVGVFAIIGRVGTGYLLDRLPTRPLAVTIFLLPVVAALLFWQGSGSLPLLILGAAILGLAQGAETDVLTYVAARQFGTRIFGSIYAMISAVMAACASLGPLIAGILYDRQGSYDLYLQIIIPVIVVATSLVLLLPASAMRQRGTTY